MGHAPPPRNTLLLGAPGATRDLLTSPYCLQEAVFVGRGDKLIACGSDDGRVYIYCSETGLLLRALKADDDVVNCVQVGEHSSEPFRSEPEQGLSTCLFLWVNPPL